MLYVVSLILIVQTVYSLINPSNYPTSNLENIENLRSMEDPPSLPPSLESASFSSVQFLECPINAKQRFEVDLDILKEVVIKWVCEVRLTGNECAGAEWVETRFLSYEEVNDLEVFVDGQSTNYYCTEYEGKKYYTIPGFNLTEENEIKRFEIYFKIERTAFIYDFAKIPWVFNENYVKFINFPIPVIPVQVHGISDVSAFKIKLGLPFRELLIKQSGWMDAFIPPRSEWILVNPDYGPYKIHLFEYPIEQEREKEGNTYFFKTYFSEENIANLIQIVIVPNWKIPALILLFISSPFYIPLFVLIKKKIKNRSNNQEPFTKKQGMAHRILKIILIPLQLYLGPLTFLLAFLTREANVEMFIYMMEIARWGLLGLVLIFLYPIFFSLIFYKWKGEI